jgi:hypothetical protein
VIRRRAGCLWFVVCGEFGRYGGGTPEAPAITHMDGPNREMEAHTFEGQVSIDFFRYGGLGTFVYLVEVEEEVERVRLDRLVVVVHNLIILDLWEDRAAGRERRSG